MSINPIRFALVSTNINCKAARLSALAFVVLSTSFAAMAAPVAGNSEDANVRYQAERAVCNNGQSNQTRATCLKEAGAALQASRMGHLNGGPGAYNQNALMRCNALPMGDRDGCQRRIAGDGTTSGSVSEGGLVRELAVPDNK